MSRQIREKCQLKLKTLLFTRFLADFSSSTYLSWHDMVENNTRGHRIKIYDKYQKTKRIADLSQIYVG